MVSQGLTRLHTLELYVRNARRSLCNFNDSFISRAFQDAPKSLRRVSVDHTTWEVRGSTPWRSCLLFPAVRSAESTPPLGAMVYPRSRHERHICEEDTRGSTSMG